MDEARSKAMEAGATMKTGGSNFNYVDTSITERLGIGFYGTKKKDGNNFIRIVAQSTKVPLALEIWKHSNIGQGKNTYLCLSKMFDKPCPICDYAANLKADGEKAEVLKELGVDHRFLLFVVDTTSRETEEEGAKWFDCPVSIWKEICLSSQDRRSGERFDPADPIDGRDIEFIRTDGKRTSYGGFKLVKTEGEIPKSWYDHLPLLEDILLMSDPEEMRTAATGMKPLPEKEESSRRDRSGEERREPDRAVRGGGEEPSRESRGRGESRTNSRRSPEDNDREQSVRDKVDQLRRERGAQRD